MGGAFELNASFPIAAGAATGSKVKVEITNQVGTATWP
jgi:hypothetical protein